VASRVNKTSQTPASSAYGVSEDPATGHSKETPVIRALSATVYRGADPSAGPEFLGDLRIGELEQDFLSFGFTRKEVNG
jgi:hypothetical protein